jgi:hypothetical protein
MAGAPCVDTSQCGFGQVCSYLIAEGCSAKGTCLESPRMVENVCTRSGAFYYDCLGYCASVSCDTPAGYAPTRVVPQPVAVCIDTAHDGGGD